MLSRLALGALIATAAGAASANVLVVRSSGPSAASYPAGRALPDNAQITLRPNDTLVLLDARGTRTFRGPGTFTPSSAVQAGQRTVTAANGRRARVGAVRSAGIVPVSPTTIWHVDVSQSGTVCVADPQHVMLWRPDPAQTATLTVAGPNGTTRRVQWPAGETSVAFPSDLQIASGGEYRFSQEGVAVPTQVTFKTLQSPPSDLPGIAEALIENGCDEQLNLLVDSAPRDTGPTG